METAKDIAWARFWEERGRSYPDDDPVAIDGWDYGISLMGQEQAGSLREQVARELTPSPQTSLLEVGCGAGMFLAPLSGLVERAVGCDLSESMVKRARQIESELTIQVAEACHLSYASHEFDAVLMYSVFHYFPSDDYALRALKELLRVCRKSGGIWIGDIPDKAKQQQALWHREKLMKQSRPKWQWPSIGPLEHRFYDQEFFIDCCERAGCDYRFVQQTAEGYMQGKYRYNLFIEKR